MISTSNMDDEKASMKATFSQLLMFRKQQS